MKKAIKLIALSLVLVMSVMLLASCGGPNKDPDKALEELKDNDYEAFKDDGYRPGVMKAFGINGVESVVKGTALIDGKLEYVTIVYFEDKDAANEAWEKIQKYAEDDKEDDDESDFQIKKTGAIVYYGTSAGMKAAG